MDLILKYPPFDAQLRKEKDQVQIFDVYRKRWLVLTPEEWVRQHMMNYLVNVKGYPASIIGMEREIELNGTKKRFDILVFDTNKLPLILIECKAPYIDLTGDTLEQALRYNLVLKARYIVISNGVSDFVWGDEQRLEELPDYTP